ncbi:Actin cytoskeleton-regulatory complex protein [Senna tora]|uniref:Actin cytoskeleton-regulatory complex protein n=1 Tax=Senna tora TaxID=362788 RepID=A0A834SNE6_9FABA|nr:Actin cytoskeleton-regulatory complex protein [Senna tora]
MVLLLLVQILVLEAMAHTDTGDEAHKIADQPVSSSKVGVGVAEAPEIRRLGKHHSNDKSVAGGGVIIGGLVTAIFAAVFCYIRVTRKRGADY